MNDMLLLSCVMFQSIPEGCNFKSMGGIEKVENYLLDASNLMQSQIFG